MDVLHSRAVPKKPPALRVVLPTIAPLVVVAFATEVTMIIGDQYGWDTMPFVLVGWCVVLLGLAAWLN